MRRLVKMGAFLALGALVGCGDGGGGDPAGALASGKAIDTSGDGAALPRCSQLPRLPSGDQITLVDQGASGLVVVANLHAYCRDSEEGVLGVMPYAMALAPGGPAGGGDPMPARPDDSAGGDPMPAKPEQPGGGGTDPMPDSRGTK